MILLVLQTVAAAILTFACLCFPRRPSVFHKGQAVDKQHTTSALGRLTWLWADEYLALARTRQRLNLGDIPKLHLRMRSSFLHSSFTSLKSRDRLWKTVFFPHSLEILLQSLLAMAQGIIQFVPQLAMYKLLELIEEREVSSDTVVTNVAWIYVLGLGLSIVVAAWMEAWLYWVVMAKVGLAMRTELSTIIFTKSMRRKDVKEVKKLVEIDAPTKSTPIVAKLKIEDGDEEFQKSRQNTINLIAVDTKRISDFVTFHFIFSLILAKLVTSIVFLSKLIGWKSLLSGFAISLLITPINIYASKRFSRAQTDLMNARDKKLAVLSEALQGIRQIKFSALEIPWQKKIGEKRREELTAQRRIVLWDTVIISIWVMGPVLLSAVSLAVYTFLYGVLTPSIAFTTIAIFSQIEMVLAIIPELTADGLEAWVSLRRIEEYLANGEKSEYITPSNDIMFEKACVAWPSDVPENESHRFILRDINLHFPHKELSIISGKTGEGKSLLLASIIGEAELIAGTIKVPRAPPADERFDYLTNKDNWIIDSSIGFVPQIPWIENGTIKDNILFNLPYDGGRWSKVIEACALRKDLEMMPDGELTDIGANGINLSGGQRWRVSFARTLYSRAGILVLDDIFSAVDAHVGRKLFNEALTGELGQGRTRILVTHHVELCLPRTKYIVVLGDGTVKSAGIDRDVPSISSLENAKEAKLKEEQNTLEQVDRAKKIHVGVTQTVVSKFLDGPINTPDSEPDAKKVMQAKMFTEDETRETGRVKLGIYKEYIKTGGGFWVWLIVVSLFVLHQGIVLGRVSIHFSLLRICTMPDEGNTYLSPVQRRKRPKSLYKSVMAVFPWFFRVF